MTSVDNNTIWNEAAKAGLLFGAVSVGCLVLKELATLPGKNWLVTLSGAVLWAVEFFGCILLMKSVLTRFRDKYQGVKMADTYKMGRRAALLSGLILASAQALFIMKMPAESLNAMTDQMMSSMELLSRDREAVEGALDKLPLITFLFQWLYCFLYGSVLAAIMSRYIFLQKLFGGFPTNFEDQQDRPDEQ